MSTLADYYQDLLTWEGVSAVPLVALWEAERREQIAMDFQSAIARSDLKSQAVPILPGSTNQSIGNQVESFLVERVRAFLSGFHMDKCAGPGYPDRLLRARLDGRKFPLEVKATGDWNPSDSNRRVLTSSSEKLRRFFGHPICHLLATACYERKEAGLLIVSVRLDFIEPSTPVNVRLEASVSHRILSGGPHVSFTF